MLSWKNTSLILFIERNKGNVALCLSFLLFLASWPLMLVDRTAAEIIRAAGEASLVGGLCDYIALNMIFEEHWFLPNSGVLPRNREKLIKGIADTIEREWLTPAMIGQKLNDLKPLDRLGEYLEQASLASMLRPDQLDRICNEAARYLEPDAIMDFIQTVTNRVGPVGAIDRVRLAVIKAFVRRECQYVREKVRTLPREPQLMAAADATIHELGVRLRDQESVVRKTADHWMEALVREVVVRSRGEIANMVRENLGRMSNEAIKTQIESRTRTHLDWIRVNGGVFGAILGCLFALMNAVHYDLRTFTRLVGF